MRESSWLPRSTRKWAGMGIVPSNLDGAIVSSHYFLFGINKRCLQADFLGWYCRTTNFHEQVNARGSTNYAAIRPHDVLGYRIPLPPVEDQMKTVDVLDRVAALADKHREIIEEIELSLLPAMMCRAFRTDSPPQE